LVPTPEEVGDGIVRMNCGHDSNLEKELVIETAKKYKKFFFNTSIPRFDFPGPVVFTANPKEEDYVYVPTLPGELDKRLRWIGTEQYKLLDNLMFVRLRVSPTNLDLVEKTVGLWTGCQIPVVLTLMAYYEEEKIPIKAIVISDGSNALDDKYVLTCYEWKIRHVNSYWCPTKEFMKYVLDRMKQIGGQLVTVCGTLDSNWCRDCRNCENFYYQTIKNMKEMEK
jgi:hypothetical protein